MRACFVDNAELPITCSHDTGEVYNCRFAMQGLLKEECIYWQPERAIALALDILGAKTLQQPERLMTTPCEQKDMISHIAKTIDRMEDGQRDIVELLKQVASQDSRLDSLEEFQERTYNEMNELFNRLREAELNQAAQGPNVRQRMEDSLTEMSAKLDSLNKRLQRLLDFYVMATGKRATYIYGALLCMLGASFASTLFNHFEWVMSVIRFWRSL